MEALKRAEESKRQAEGNTEGKVPSANLEPPTARQSNSPRNSPLPDLSLHSDAVDADLAAVSNSGPLRRTSAPIPNQSDATSHEAFERAAARNVFTAKKTPAAPKALWLFIGLSSIVAIGIGAYFWWQLQAASGGSLSRPAQTIAPPAVASVNPASATPSPTQKPVEAKAAIEPPAAAPLPILRARPEPLPAAEPAPLPRKPLPAADTAAAESPVRLNRSQPKVNQTLNRAYEALQSGRLDEAQRGYEMALRDDSKNVDALLGLATLAAHRGQGESAQAYYLRALESDPNDATAQAGLINLRGASNPGS